MIDVGCRAGRGVHVHDQPVLPGRREDGVQARGAGLVVRRATEQEAQLERTHAGLAGQRERLGGAVGVGLARRDPQPGPDPVVGVRGLDHELVEGEGDVRVGHPVVGQHQRALGALDVEVGEQLGDGRAGAEVGAHRGAAVERVGGQHAEMAVGVAMGRHDIPAGTP